MTDETTEQAEQAEGNPGKPPNEKQAKPAKPAKAKKTTKDGKAAGKKSKGKGAKARAADAASDAASHGPSVAGHPRAGSQVRRAKGWGGLGGFAIAAYLSLQAGIPTYDIGLRALAAGAAGYLLAWACSVTVWRHLVLAELRAAADRGTSERAEQSRGND